MTERECRHDTQDKVDGIEAAILGLNQAVTANRELIMANRELIMTNQERNEQQFAEINAMLQAIIKDQNVPYKPPMGFMKDK